MFVGDVLVVIAEDVEFAVVVVRRVFNRNKGREWVFVFGVYRVKYLRVIVVKVCNLWMFLFDVNDKIFFLFFWIILVNYLEIR